MGKRQPLHKWCWENWIAACKGMKLDYFLIPYTKISSKWIKEIIKLLEEDIGSNFFDVTLSNIFLDMSP